MDFPGFYRPARVGELYQPDVGRAVAAGLAAAGQANASGPHRLLLLVDPQVDFIHVDGALPVPGAVQDARRTIEWIFRNLGRIDSIAVSLDSHTPLQIFFPTWWIGEDGRHPEPYTVIPPEQVQSGRWQPLYQQEWSRTYLERLHHQAKKDLMIWPFHTMIGTTGHAITPALYEALAFHSAASGRDPRVVMKGTLPGSEFYSLLEAEVKQEGADGGGFNRGLVDWMAGFDAVYVAGQAKSHCVLETLASVVRYFDGRPEMIGKFHLLTDCTSSVQHPQVDFETLARNALEEFERRGLKLVRSTDPIE